MAGCGLRHVGLIDPREWDVVPKREKPFNNPFAGLKLAKSAPPPPKPVPEVAAVRIEACEDDGALFRSAVGDVEPVRGAERLPRENGCVSADSLGIVDPEAEALAELCELVAKTGPLDVTNSQEYIEGFAPGLDVRISRQLRRGHYSIQAHVDLHGHTREEAKKELNRFIEEAHRRGHRLVLVVHGRGLHSKDQIPVLKERLRIWLSRGRISRHVLAFTSAQGHDGGLGAVYVLLRR
jgi:DNA-nicking Smr family endonuclease